MKQPYPFSAIVGTDEEATVLAASASKALGLPHNSPESVTAAHDKYRFRCLLEEAGMRSPWFQLVSLREDLPAAAAQANYPCVLKPLCLSASRGVIRADRMSDAGEDRAGVEGGDNPHERDPRDGITRLNGALDRRGAAIGGQQRSVQVDEATPREGEHFVREDLAVRRHDADVGRDRGERVQKLRIAESFGR